MRPQKLLIVVGSIVLFTGALAAVSCGPIGANLPPKNDGVPIVDANFTGMAPATQPRKSQSDDSKPAPKRVAAAKDAGKQPVAVPQGPLTVAEATRLGRGTVGRRVKWWGQWTNSQSETVKGKKGAVHVFNSPDANGDYTFQFPFMAEDTNPLDSVPRGMDVRAHFDAKWGPARIVIVTGTIAKVERLIMIGQGTRDNVPVLTDIAISLDF
jgi:hypothetical protein